MKMGDYIKTLVDKKAPWGAETIFALSGSISLVCEVFDGDALMIEKPDSLPFALVVYEKGEYIKIDEETMKNNYSKPSK